MNLYVGFFVWAGTICCIYLTSKLGRLLLTRQYCIYCIYLLCRVVDSMYGRRIMHCMPSCRWARCLCRLLCERGLVPKGRYLQWHTRWVPKMTLKKGRALRRLPLIFIKVTSWINSKCRIYTTFKLWHKGTATRLGAKLWQCSLESVW